MLHCCERENSIPFVDDVKASQYIINGTNNFFLIQAMRKIVIRNERIMEIDIRIVSGDSLIRHGGIWNFGGTAPIILNSELDKRKG